MELLGYSLMEYLDEQKMTICPNLNILQNALVLISLLYAISQDQQKASNEKKSRVLPQNSWHTDSHDALEIIEWGIEVTLNSFSHISGGYYSI